MSAQRSLRASTTIFTNVTSLVYVCFWPAGLSRNTYVTQLHATDADSGLNGQLFYEITNPSDIQSHFEIAPAHTGIVLTRVTLDVEIRQEYRVYVTAYDRGEPQLSSSCLLKIKVMDVNDNRPHFGQSVITRHIAEGSVTHAPRTSQRHVLTDTAFMYS